MSKLMKTVLGGCAALACLSGTAAIAEPFNDYQGRWVGVSDDDLPVIEIRRQGRRVYVRAEGRCHPTNCDWGEVRATAFSPSAATRPFNDTELIVAEFDQAPGTGTLILRLRGERLSAQFLREFRDGDSRHDYVSNSMLERPRGGHPGGPGGYHPGGPGGPGGPGHGPGPSHPGPSYDADCLSFNRSNLRVEPYGSQWRLLSGNSAMLIAPNRYELDRAREIINRYGIGQQCFVGRPNASLHYWLTPGGRAPQGAFGGEDCIRIAPNELAVRRNSSSSYSVVDRGDHLAFSAPSREEAEEIIAVIQEHQFTYSCFVGRPGPSFAYLRR